MSNSSYSFVPFLLRVYLRKKKTAHSRDMFNEGGTSWFNYRFHINDDPKKPSQMSLGSGGQDPLKQNDRCEWDFCHLNMTQEDASR